MKNEDIGYSENNYKEAVYLLKQFYRYRTNIELYQRTARLLADIEPLALPETLCSCNEFEGNKNCDKHKCEHEWNKGIENWETCSKCGLIEKKESSHEPNR